MKKTIVSLLLMAVFLLTSVSTVFADEYVDDIPQSSHKIKNKWDFMGTFTDNRGWLGSTYFEIHIKEAEYGPYSKGVILFESGDNYITAHVEDMKFNYDYWYDGAGHPEISNIAAVGWAEYNGEVFNFMFLYNANAIWIALSNNSYETYWNSGTVWSVRDFQLHSTVVTDQFDITPK